MIEKQIALFDVDNTIYQGYVIFPLAELQAKEGLILTDCYEQLQRDKWAHLSKEIDYETFARDAMRHWTIGLGLTGKPYLTILDHAEMFLRDSWNNFYPYFSRVVHMINHEYDIYLVTAEPQFVTEAIEKIFLLPQSSAHSSFEVVNDVFTGKADVLDTSQEKNRAIERLLGNRDMQGSIAFGDSESDIDMLEKTKFQVCIELEEESETNKKLLEHAGPRGWNIAKPADVERVVREVLGFT